MVNFEAVFVEKVPKNSVFNRECLENGDFWDSKKSIIQKRVK